MSRRATPPCALLALAAAVLLALPATALAARRTEPHFELGASNGYRIEVSVRDATALLRVARPGHSKRRRSSSIYIARAKRGHGEIEATFGELGRFSVAFHPSGRVAYGRIGKFCRKAERKVTRYGVYTGAIHFRGEGGYTAVSAHRVKGKLVTPPGLGCLLPSLGDSHGGQGSKRPRSKVTWIDASTHSATDLTYFHAAVDSAHGVSYFAVTEQSEGRLAIYHFAFVRASPQTFVTDSALSFASVSPPAPFSGTGSLGSDEEGDRDWSGSLAVSFPGAPDVPLTGPQFHVRLFRSF